AMPPPPNRRRMRYRLPVARRSALISSSGFSRGVPATSGRAPAHRPHAAASARFRVPHSGQNMLGSELHLHEVEWRPRSSHLDANARRCLLLCFDFSDEVFPVILLDEKCRAQYEAWHSFGAQRERGDGGSAEHAHTLRRDGSHVVTYVVLLVWRGAPHVNAAGDTIL